jgi:tetratricopeptide (TPR) repeat protein
MEDHMRKLWIALVAILGLASVAQAADRPWEASTALLDTILPALQAQGITAMEPHVPEVEAVLGDAPELFTEPQVDAGKTYVLTEGQAESLLALAGAAGQGGGDVVAVFNPYPRLALYLGVYYVEIGRFDDAVRVLDAGLALSPAPEALLGETVPDLLAEKGVALGRLQQLDEALATYDKGIAIPQMDDAMRAVLYRGRGFVLIEQNRLDEAEAAYETSLELAPGNDVALSELAYIQSLRAGGKTLPPTLTAPGGKMGKGS